MTAMTNAIFTLLCMVGLWWVLFGRYGQYQAQRFDREMVEIRRRMYNWARHYKIPLNDPAYRILRNAIVGMTSLKRHEMLFALIWNRDTRTSTFRRRLEEASGLLDEHGRNRLLHFRERMNLAALKYLILSPAILITVIPPLLAWMLIRYRNATLVKLFEPAFDRLDDRALAKGAQVDGDHAESSEPSGASGLGTDPLSLVKFIFLPFTFSA